MSICSSGLDAPCRVQPVTIEVSPTHPLIQLAQVIPWPALAELVLPDLQQTTAKGKWWLGRKLKLRIQLGAFLRAIALKSVSKYERSKVGLIPARFEAFIVNSHFRRRFLSQEVECNVAQNG